MKLFRGLFLSINNLYGSLGPDWVLGVVIWQHFTALFVSLWNKPSNATLAELPFSLLPRPIRLQCYNGVLFFQAR